MKGTINVSSAFFAGFTLAGYQQPDGSIISSSGAIMNGWPDEITVEGTTFTLEEVRFVGREGDPKGRFMNAEYV